MARNWPMREWNDPGSPLAAHRPKVGHARRRRIFERDGWACRQCGVSFADCIPENPQHAPFRVDVGYLHLDHIVPVSRGGSVKDEDNLQSLCEPCNNRKGARV